MSVAGVRATGRAGRTPVNSERRIQFMQGEAGNSVHAGTAKETLPGVNAPGASQLIALEEQLHSWVTGVKKNNLVHPRVSK